MQTTHRIYHGDSGTMDSVADESVDLVVTSPPYPMIDMWDEVFIELDPAIGTALSAGNGPRAYSLMHDRLTATWREVHRVLVDGGIACINIGDATRTIGGRFRVYQNHAAIINAFTELGFEPLPDILWRKPTNSVTKFLGSGMIPPNAYATLEHEFILVFRKGVSLREFEPGDDRRYESAYFWEERNDWFTDLWTDITGVNQTLDGTDLRDRSAAFPFVIPYRLINMYSIYGDTVLDPFWGTGTTSIAAMVTARNSVGYELDGHFRDHFAEQVSKIPSLSADVVENRYHQHEAFVADRVDSGEPPKYVADHYPFRVITAQETGVRFYEVADVDAIAETTYVATHTPYPGTPSD